MKLEPECVACIFSQALRVCQTLGIDKQTTKRVLDEVASMVPGFSFSQTPPQVAADVYPRIADILGVDDIYRDYKAEAVRHAASIADTVEKRVFGARNRFHAALKASVAGNVIDLAATHSFSLEEEVARVFETPFAVDDSEELYRALLDAKRLLFIGDNAGEHLFDRILLRIIAEEFPQIETGYAVRGRPIINDITLKEAKEAGIDKVARIIDSGVDTPGFDLQRLSEEARKFYESADLVIAKGMGNYESMNDTSTKPTFYLLKVKCSVVASSLNRNIGDIICYKGACNV